MRPRVANILEGFQWVGLTLTVICTMSAIVLGSAYITCLILVDTPAEAQETKLNWQRVVIHHTATPEFVIKNGMRQRVIFDRFQCAEVHKKRLGVDHCGYNFLIHRDGRIEEAQGYTKRGAHVKNMNSTSLGVAFVMDGRQEEPTEYALAAWNKLYREISEVYGNLRVVRHSDLRPTMCPTDNVWRHIEE